MKPELNEDQLVDEMAALIQESQDTDDVPTQVWKVYVEMTRRHPDVSREGWRTISELARLRTQFKCDEQVRRMQVTIDRRAGRLMRESPRMTFRQAVALLGVWSGVKGL